MPDILHDFPIAAPPVRVFAVLCSPAGLDAWWTLESAGRPGVGERYRLCFGPGYDWAGTMVRCEAAGTDVSFHHTGWRTANAHFRISSFCWAMYLRLLKRHIETGDVVPYKQRLDV